MSETETTDLQELILRLVHSPDYQPVKPKVIAKQLGLPKERARELRKAVKRLAREGKIWYGENHLVKRPEAGERTTRTDKPLITGEFRRAAKGYGFVRPIGTPPSAGRELDIFIPLRRTADASTGDIVKVRLKPPRRDETKQNGAIVEIVERETNQFVGTYLERNGQAFVQIDGNIVTEPVPVGDPGAKNAMEGDKVVIEMIRFPTHLHPGEGVIVEVLGARGAPGVDTLSIIREFNLPDRFPLHVMDTARVQAEQFDESIGDRLDLTGETIITIDPKDARDFDDAISLERLENGHWRLGVHIADVAHFVPTGSPLDLDARDRGTSVYLPDRVLPMLPELICNGLASLQPDKVRYAKTAFIEFTADGARVAADFHNSSIPNSRTNSVSACSLRGSGGWWTRRRKFRSLAFKCSATASLAASMNSSMTWWLTVCGAICVQDTRPFLSRSILISGSVNSIEPPSSRRRRRIMASSCIRPSKANTPLVSFDFQRCGSARNSSTSS